MRRSIAVVLVLLSLSVVVAMGTVADNHRGGGGNGIPTWGVMVFPHTVCSPATGQPRLKLAFNDFFSAEEARHFARQVAHLGLEVTPEPSDPEAERLVLYPTIEKIVVRRIQ